MQHFGTICFSLVVLLLVGQEALVDGQNYYGPLQSSIAVQTSLPTVTVRGFLNFRTTVDGTVIVFTPSPSASQSTALANAAPVIAPTQPPARPFPEIRPTRINHNHGGQGHQTYPTGLVTVLGGTVVNEGSTTVYETKVIGTYISGKYAQILSSSIKDMPMASPTIRPTHSYTHPLVHPTRVASSPRHSSPPPPPIAAPVVRQPVHQPKEEEAVPNAIHKKVHPLRAKSLKLIESSKARHLSARFALNPLKSRWAKQVENAKKPEEETDDAESQENRSVVKIRKPRVGNSRFSLSQRQQAPKVKFNRFKSNLPPTQAEEMQQYYTTKSKLEEETKKREELEEAVKEKEKEKEKDVIDQQTKQKILEGLTSTTAAPNDDDDMNGYDEMRPPIDPSKVVKEVQTITSEVTQHVDGNHLQVKTLTLTTTIERTLHPTESEFDTAMVKPTLDLSANDLEATSIPETPALVMTRTYSVTERTMRTTVVPVFDGTSTQSHTVTESFFIRKLITAYRTLPPGDIFIDSTSTLSPSEALNTELINGTEILDLSMAEQGIQPSSVEGMIAATQMPSFSGENETKMTAPVQPLMPSLDPSLGFGQMPQMFAQNQFAQKFDLNNPLLMAAVLQNPQLAAMYFGFQQMKQQQQQQQYNTLTKPTQVLQTETIYNTKVVSFYDGRTTRSRTILEPAGTTEKLMNTFTTQLVPIMNPNPQIAALQQAQMQNAFATQMGMPMGMQMPQFQMTPSMQSSTTVKTVTTVTEATMTKSKVYTLVYNALSTRYRTITSTSVMPTTITTVLTETVQVPVASQLPNMNFFG